MLFWIAGHNAAFVKLCRRVCRIPTPHRLAAFRRKFLKPLAAVYRLLDPATNKRRTFPAAALARAVKSS